MSMKHMAKKTTKNSKDTTSKHVKNTQTGVEPKAAFTIRWYHIAATVGVIVLVVVALVVVVHKLDPSIITSRYTLKYAVGCTTSFSGHVEDLNRHYRYAGVSNGSMVGKNGPTTNASEAYLKIIELGNDRVKIEERDYETSEWEEQTVEYGDEEVVITQTAPDCMPGITYTINK